MINTKFKSNVKSGMRCAFFFSSTIPATPPITPTAATNEVNRRITVIALKKFKNTIILAQPISIAKGLKTTGLFINLLND